MERFKYSFLLPILCIFLLQGCIHADLDDCPPMVRYAVAFKYTNHTGNNDRFYDDVKKINLYVFDDKSLIYTTTTGLSPYEDNFNISLEDIPMGRYTIIAWGNVLDSEPFLITPENFVTGETTLDEARLFLQQTANGLSNTELEKLFYGELKTEIPLYTSRIDTISLTNDTKRVRVAVHWDFSKIEDPEDRVNIDSVKVFLKGVNAEYKFDNNIVSTPVRYEPYAIFNNDSVDNNKDWWNIYYYSESNFNENQKSVYYDFSILRFIKDVPVNLFIRYNLPVISYDVTPPSGIDIVSTSSGFQYLFSKESIASSEWQNTFDKYDYYRIDLYVVQVDKYQNTFVTGNIHINDWVVTPVDEGGTEF